jgi:galactokinase
MKLNMDDTLQIVRKKFTEYYSEDPIMVRAPGRINLIGEHTDYNEGFVFPAAIGHEIAFAIGRSNHPTKCSLFSIDLNEKYDFSLDDFSPVLPNNWQNYILGVAAGIINSKRQIAGFNLVFSGNIPQGSGMSSSAALECGTCFGLNELFQLDIPKLEMVKISQEAEHEYAGVKCGIMDQFASMMGSKSQAFKLDCRDLSYEHFPINLEDHSLVLINSNVTHDLATSAYNVRREQCEEGVEVLKSEYPEISALRDATIEQLIFVKNEMKEVVFKRCKYIIEENQRVVDFSKALKSQDLTEAGEILKQAQLGMKVEYEITCPEIDLMAEFANAKDYVLGARMMGGGFGGCTLNLMVKGNEEEFIKDLNAVYFDSFKKEISPISIEIVDGVSRIVE